MCSLTQSVNYMEAFYLKYQKLLIVISVVCFLCLPFDVYQGITTFVAGEKYRAIGEIIDGVIIFVLAPIFLLIGVRNAKKAGVARTN